MDENVFEIIKLVLQIVLIAISAWAIPAVKKWFNANATAKQKEQAEYWTVLAIQFAERIFKEKGAGALKKEWVLEWLNKNNIPITKKQADILIDMIVKEFNENGWDKPIVTE